ncbi:aminoglycoside phosphotransferase family protein [Occultella glacieicola]|uniref:Aminoglycoside phosphotransferase family protein n=1 Tax=Occultella glacieicola TaxID=2518684 RepID=A0ABY2E373_9MICO|nr:aminoglycoside phosphotransferase family protein [Occultella glacieicola]TDE94077.1 aminoglycoside phosphotransferase family protein [Occultella glacieicola]
MLADLGSRSGLWTDRTQPTTVARGSENTTFAVGGFIVRRTVDVDALTREVALLEALAGETSIPVPVPLVHRSDLGVLVYRALGGEPLLGRPDLIGPAVEGPLVDVLGALRRIRPDPPLVVDDHPNDAWLAGARQDFETARSHLGPERAAAVAQFLDQPPPPAGPVLVPQHNDLGAEHILVDDRGRVSGVIDWSDAARTEPARDIGRLLRDLGPAIALAVAAGLDGQSTAEERLRMTFHARCTWLEDLAYGLADPAGRSAYLANAERVFGHVFGHA